MKKTAFEKKCEAAAEATGVRVVFFNDDGKRRMNEDDGALHIANGRGLRACFDVGNGQSFDAAQQNIRTEEVIEALGMKATPDVFLDEGDEDDEVCPHCGR